jgi:competence protein ComEC
MFIYSCIFFIVAVFIHFFFLQESYFYFFLILFLINLALLFFYRKSNNTKIFYTFCSFFIFGMLVVSWHIKNNNTIMLDYKLEFKKIHGEIYKIEKSLDEDKSYLYLKNIEYPKEQTNNFASTLKLSYKKQHNLEIGDIIKATVSVFPHSLPVYPWGFNFKKYGYFNKIGGNGFIIGIPILIDNKNNLINGEETKGNEITKNVQNYLKQKIFNTKINEINKSFLAASSLGTYKFLPKPHIDNLRDSGLAHYISISGYHIGLIIIFLFFSIRFSLSCIPYIALNYNTKKITALITIIFLLDYLNILDGHLPATRAIIMGIAIMLGILISFKVISVNSLFLAGIITLIFIPQAIYSASFLLSFFATLTIIMFWNHAWVQKLFAISKKNLLSKVLFWFLSSIILTFLIQISLAPILSYYFGKVPLMGLFANVLVSPIFSFIIMPFLLLFYLTPSFLSNYLIIPADFGMGLVLKIAEHINQSDFTNYEIKLIPSYFLAILLFLFLLIPLKKNLKLQSSLMLIIFVIPWVYFFYHKKPDILIDYDGKVSAFKLHNIYYVSEPKKEQFIQNIWFKKTEQVLSLKQSDSFNCEDFHCVVKIKNKLVSFAQNSKYFKEDCGAVNIVIMPNENAPFVCENLLVIDKQYLKENGSLILYLD